MRHLSLTGCLALAAAGGCGGKASQPGSSPSDAGGGGIADSGSWCSSQSTLFCEDFDEYASIGDLYASTKWSSHSETNGSFRLTTSTSPPSPPNSLEVIGGDTAAVALVKTFDSLVPPSKHARLEFDLRIDNTGTDSGFNGSPDPVSSFAGISFGAGIHSGYVVLSIWNGSELMMTWAPPSDPGHLMNTRVMTFPAIDRWSGRFAIDIDYAQSCVQIYDGTSAKLNSCVPLPQELLAARPLSISLGDQMEVGNVNGQVDLEFDDVTFDAR